MATIGLTELEAVNAMLETIGIDPVPSIDATGTGDGDQALRVLRRVSRAIQTRGWPCNTKRSRAFTAAGSPAKIQVPATTLAIIPSGPSYYRPLVLQGDYIFDMAKDSNADQFTAAEVVYCDLISFLSYESCSPDLKELILTEAMKVFQRREDGNQVKDGQLGEETTRADIHAHRLPVLPNAGAINPQPVLIGVPPQGAGR